MRIKIILVILMIVTGVTAKSSNLISAPTNFRVDDRSKFDMYIFSWNPVFGASGYKIYYKRPDSSTSEYVSVSASARAVRLYAYQLKYPINYTLYVVAIDSQGNQSNPSNSVIYGCDPGTFPSRVTNVKASTITDNSVNLTWDESISRIPLHGYYVINDNNIAIAFSVTNSVVLNGLNQANSYNLKIRAFNDFGCYNDSGSFIISTYCTPPAGNNDKASAGSYITKVNLGSINNSTGYDGQFYANRRALNTALTKGLSNTVKVTTVATDENLNAGVVAYIDFNNNGIFNDSGETITFGAMATKQKSINVPVTFISNPFTVPSTVINGFTTLRVIYQRTPGTLSFNPCSFPNPSKGEVEDYGIYLADGSSRMVTPDNLPEAPVDLDATVTDKKELAQLESQKIAIYPNPATGNELTITNVENNVPYTIMDQMGRIVTRKAIDNNKIDISSLSKGLHILYIKVNGKEHFKKFIKN